MLVVTNMTTVSDQKALAMIHLPAKLQTGLSEGGGKGGGGGGRRAASLSVVQQSERDTWITCLLQLVDQSFTSLVGLHPVGRELGLD